MQEVSATVIEPRFRALGAGDVREKGPGEVVTVADEEAEALLSAALPTFPGAIGAGVVVGEEAAAADPKLLDAVDAPRCWLVDPIDGTSNFVAGSPDWAVMVALLSYGRPVASWIWRPVERVMYVAERGGGAARNGARLRLPPGGPASAETLKGAVLTGFLDPATRTRVTANRGRLGQVTPGRRCAGVDYPLVAEGEQDFVMFWRTLAWDHAPGALLVEEAGGYVARPDGRPYVAGDEERGLIAASSPGAWATVRAALLG